MASSFEFEAELRANTGKGDARRLRHSGLIPAIIYGGSADPVSITLVHHKVEKALQNEAVYAHILDVKVNGTVEKVILKAMQRHPSRPIIMHMDFQRVSESDKVKVHVPLHFINEAVSVGVKKGGSVSHTAVEVEVSCLPQRLPEFIEVDLTNLDVGQSIHLSDLSIPAGVELVALAHGSDLNIVTIHAARGGESQG